MICRVGSKSGSGRSAGKLANDDCGASRRARRPAGHRGRPSAPSRKRKHAGILDVPPTPPPGRPGSPTTTRSLAGPAVPSTPPSRSARRFCPREPRRPVGASPTLKDERRARPGGTATAVGCDGPVRIPRTGRPGRAGGVARWATRGRGTPRGSRSCNLGAAKTGDRVPATGSSRHSRPYQASLTASVGASRSAFEVRYYRRVMGRCVRGRCALIANAANTTSAMTLAARPYTRAPLDGPSRRHPPAMTPGRPTTATDRRPATSASAAATATSAAAAARPRGRAAVAPATAAFVGSKLKPAAAARINSTHATAASASKTTATARRDEGVSGPVRPERVRIRANTATRTPDVTRKNKVPITVRAYPCAVHAVPAVRLRRSIAVHALDGGVVPSSTHRRPRVRPQSRVRLPVLEDP